MSTPEVLTTIEVICGDKRIAITVSPPNTDQDIRDIAQRISKELAAPAAATAQHHHMAKIIRLPQR